MRQSKRRHPRKGFEIDMDATPKTETQRVKPLGPGQGVDGEEDTGEPWKTVKGRLEKEKKSRGISGDAPRKKPRGRLSEALLVTVEYDQSDQSYADVLRHLKKRVDPDSHGVKVSGIRRTRGGELHVKIGKAGGKAEDLREAFVGALNGKATVRSMSPTVIVEILHIDEATDETELSEALNEATGNIEAKSVDIKAIRTVYRGTKKAVVAMPAVTADNLFKEGRHKVGWVRCRIREKIEVTRCFRCLGFGHVARDCKGEDRSNMCRLCGSKEHLAKACKSPPPPHCMICAGGNEIDGAQHILGRAKCKSIRRELSKARKRSDSCRRT